MAKNLSTKSRWILNDYAGEEFFFVEYSSAKNFKSILIFFCETQFFIKFLALWTCFCKFYIFKKSSAKKKSSLIIRRLFVDNFFDMCRWALSSGLSCKAKTSTGGAAAATWRKKCVQESFWPIEHEARRDKSLLKTRSEYRNGQKVRINFQYFSV